MILKCRIAGELTIINLPSAQLFKFVLDIDDNVLLLFDEEKQIVLRNDNWIVDMTIGEANELPANALSSLYEEVFNRISEIMASGDMCIIDFDAIEEEIYFSKYKAEFQKKYWSSI